jgi:5-formyltetrahydrofolate cyclo-ligase
VRSRIRHRWRWRALASALPVNCLAGRFRRSSRSARRSIPGLCWPVWLPDGFKTCVPVVVQLASPLEFRAWVPGEETVPGRWNIPVPPETAKVVEPDVLLVPLLAFDAAGFRLGYGGGFYDRTIERLRAIKPVLTVGVAYAGQQVDKVVRGAHDERLDWILTEAGAMKTGDS